MQKKLIIVCCLLFSFFSCTQEKKTNWGVTLEKKNKDPYGCYIAYDLLSQIFPDAEISNSKNFIKHINEVVNQTSSYSAQNNLTILTTQNLILKDEEFDKVQSYISMGNYLLILSENYSKNITDYFNVEETGSYSISTFDAVEQLNSCAIRFNKNYTNYDFLGRNAEAFFILDSSKHQDFNIVGYTKSIDYPNLLKNGNFIIGRNPYVFSNYFLLQNSNREYYQKLLSYFPKKVNTVTWFSQKKYGSEEDDSDLSKLLRIPAIRYAFFIFLGLLIIYTLFESKRRQKIIPVIPPNTNSSLEFAETIGMLYYNKKDNANLAEKMIQYYLEYLRSKYSLKTNVLNDSFALLLAYKINKSETDTKAFVAYLNYIRETNEVSDNDIKHLYHQIKKFS